MAVASAPVRRGLNYRHIWTVARTDLKQLAQARDYWIPMLILGGIFFVFVPTVLLFTITQPRQRRRGEPAQPGARGASRRGAGRDPG